MVTLYYKGTVINHSLSLVNVAISINLHLTKSLLTVNNYSLVYSFDKCNAFQEMKLLQLGAFGIFEGGICVWLMIECLY